MGRSFRLLRPPQTEPARSCRAHAGNTVSGGSKPATVETGAQINVPLFVNVGDKITIDTRSETYLGRANDK